MKTEKESAITEKVMKTEKQIQEEVWKSLEAKYRVYEWDITAAKIITEAVSKTIELTRPTIGIIRHEKIDVDAYKCGYEKALKELKSNVLKDSTAAIIHQNGYDEGYAACVKEIEEKLSKDQSISYESWKQGYIEGCTDFEAKLKEKMEVYSDNFERGNLNPLISEVKKELTCQKK